MLITCVFFGFRQKNEILIVPVATFVRFHSIAGCVHGAPPGFGKCCLSYTFWVHLNDSSFDGDILGMLRFII